MISGLELGTAIEMALVASEMVTGMVSELELEIQLGKPSESKLIGQVSFKEIHDD